jgi:hypothetical protein
MTFKKTYIYRQQQQQQQGRKIKSVIHSKRISSQEKPIRMAPVHQMTKREQVSGDISVQIPPSLLLDLPS